MNKFAALAAVATLTVFTAPVAFAAESSETVRAATENAAAAPAARAGMMLYSGGNRVAPIYRVTAEGNPQIILNGKMVTVPAATLTTVNGKTATTLTKAELSR